jgi:hypothetical protein
MSHMVLEEQENVISNQGEINNPNWRAHILLLGLLSLESYLWHYFIISPFLLHISFPFFELINLIFFIHRLQLSHMYLEDGLISASEVPFLVEKNSS